MKLLDVDEEPSTFATKRWVAAIRGLVDRHPGPGASEDALRMATIEQK
jgi:hypothetical protein